MGLDGSRYGNINRDVIALDNIKWDVIALGIIKIYSHTKI